MKKTENDEFRRYVRITGTRGRFVTFDFAIGGADLVVELIMPFEAFREFCANNQAVELSPEDSVRVELEKLRWRHGVINE